VIKIRHLPEYIQARFTQQRVRSSNPKKKIGPEKSKLKIIKVNLGSRRGGKAKEGF
jgi:hypothetical protein